jgi:hypothetical protein
MGFLNKTSNTHSTLITICNWSSYQNDNNEDNTLANLRLTNTQPTVNN